MQFRIFFFFLDGNKDNRVEKKYKAKKKKKIPHLYEHRSKIDSKTTKLLSKRKKKLKSIFFFFNESKYEI